LITEKSPAAIFQRLISASRPGEAGSCSQERLRCMLLRAAFEAAAPSWPPGENRAE
jgi:hypothetical protein